MSVPLGRRLSAARHEQFVGRAAELALFESALAAPELPFHVLHVVGPGGVGKTSLLREFTRLCEQRGTPATCVDARDVEASPDALAGELGMAVGAAPNQTARQGRPGRQNRQVLLVDTFEKLVHLSGWLLETFLPALPDDALVVLAGRNPPTPDWRADPGWQSVIRVVALQNLNISESRDYLTRRAIPADQRQGVIDFTHGHPLALSLVADVFAQRPGLRFEPEAAPDVVKALLEQFAQKVPGPAHRAALEVCSLVRLTTEGLLAEMLAMPDAHELFDWLRGLSFIESGRLGLFPHDLAREALAADVRWRNPDWYADLHKRARMFYTRRLKQTRGRDQEQVLFDYVFLHRDNPVVRPFFNLLSGNTDTETWTDAPHEAELPTLVAMVAEHEGDEAARLAELWYRHLPEGILVFRNARKQAVGLLVMVSLNTASAQNIEADPATRAAWEYLERNAPLRPGEEATLFRFWMAADTYQAVSATQGLIFVNMVRHYLTTPGLAFTFLPCADPDFWAPLLAYADLTRITQADFEVGGRRYGVYGHDWRAVPPLAWLALLAERETESASQVPTPTHPAAPLVVLNREDFVRAVRAALRDLLRLDSLAQNPLLRSRLVVELVGDPAATVQQVDALRQLITESTESLRASPRDEKLYRAVLLTYLSPAPTQEQAAERLDIPFSTFRRHLTAGVARVAEDLWEREIHAKAW